MAIKNVAGYRAVVTAVAIGTTAAGWLLPRVTAPPPLTVDEAPFAGVHIVDISNSCMSWVLAALGLWFGLTYGKRLAFELFNEKAGVEIAPQETAVRATPSPSEPT